MQRPQGTARAIEVASQVRILPFLPYEKPRHLGWCRGFLSFYAARARYVFELGGAAPVAGDSVACRALADRREKIAALAGHIKVDRRVLKLNEENVMKR